MYIFVTGTEGMWDDYYCHDSDGHGYVCRTAQGKINNLNSEDVNIILKFTFIRAIDCDFNLQGSMR